MLALLAQHWPAASRLISKMPMPGTCTNPLKLRAAKPQKARGVDLSLQVADWVSSPHKSERRRGQGGALGLSEPREDPSLGGTVDTTPPAWRRAFSPTCASAAPAGTAATASSLRFRNQSIFFLKSHLFMSFCRVCSNSVNFASASHMLLRNTSGKSNLPNSPSFILCICPKLNK